MKKTLISCLLVFVMILGLMSGMVQAEEETKVYGKVLDPNGSPMAYVTVELYNGNTLVSTDYTDHEGNYTIAAKNGSYTLTWYGNGAWRHSKAVSVNGATKQDLQTETVFRLEVAETVNVGDIYDLSFVIENHGDTAFGAKSFSVTTVPTLIGLLSPGQWSTPEVASGSRHVTTLKAVALVGGSESIVLDVDGTQYSFELFVSGKGWYAGDAHTHSDFFDGAHSIRENVNASRELGLDWLYSTDHNLLPSTHPYKQINSEFNGKFINLMATELTIWRHTTAGKDSGHMLSYRVNKVVNGYTAPSSGIAEGSNRKWKNTIEAVRQQGGFMYVAHPYLTEYATPDEEKYNLPALTGVEVINWCARETEPNAQAFLFWDALNAKGNGMYNGINNSDAHDRKYLAMVFNKCRMDSLSIDNVNDALEKGNFYGSNGPDVRFTMGGAEMGEELKVNGTQKVRVYLSAYDSRSYLKTITLYRMKITGDWMGSYTKTAVHTVNLMGQNKNFYEEYVELEVSPDEMYRVEVTSTLCHHPITRTVNRYEGYAFTNPIWVHGGEKNGITQLNFVKYNGSNGSVVTNGKGEAFILLNSGDLDINALSVSADSRTTVTKSYAKGGNGKAGRLTLTVKAEDGTVRTQVLCVVSPNFV